MLKLVFHYLNYIHCALYIALIKYIYYPTYLMLNWI
jgi:hypothetical protein